MKLRLLSLADLQTTHQVQFYPGPNYREISCAEGSVYLDMDVFEALCYLVGHFDMFGPMTLSGTRLQQCIDDLEAAAKQVSQSGSPSELWDYAPNYGCCQFLEVEQDWQAERRNFSLMLRDLAVWMRGVHARKEPVTCLGL